jgi:ribonucleoside-diphosphate reductase alpha chain
MNSVDNRLPADVESQIVNALSKSDLDLAKTILHNYVNVVTCSKNSWDSPQYQASRSIQETITVDYSRDELITFMGLSILRDRYFLRDEDGEICEDAQKFFARVATGIAKDNKLLAQEIYDEVGSLKFMPATPILSNIGTTRGLPISCFLNTVGDSIGGIMETLTENAHLSKGGGGIGTDWSTLRGRGAKIHSINGKSSGTIPFIKAQESLSLAVHQGGLRRGSSAAYLRVDHPDIEEFVELRKPNGDTNRKTLELHNAVVLTDKFMEAVKSDSEFSLINPDDGTISKVVKAKDLWKKILACRVETGEPYLMFYDTVQESRAQGHKDQGLFIRQSNLCSEILEPTSTDRTAVCCLGSINLEAIEFDILTHEGQEKGFKELKRVSKIATEILNRVLNIFIECDKEGYIKAINSAKKERSIGIGVMGWHGFLMKNHLEVGGIQSLSFNKVIFGAIKEAAKDKSQELATKYPCHDTKGFANTYLMAIAPTANISIIAGGCTPCIEPIAGNAYTHKTLSGTFLVKNKYLVDYLESIGQNTNEVWDSILEKEGSVQTLDFLDEKAKLVFRTAYEIPTKDIIRLAADRQQFICQSQSLNLFYTQPISMRQLHEDHFFAWENKVKTLYYLRSESVIKADSINSTQGARVDECTACQ